MTSKDKQTYGLIAVAIIVIILAYIYKSKSPSESTTNSNNQPTTTQQNTQNSNTTTTTKATNQTSTQSVWTGTLKVSDNLSKGSLMLVNNEHTIYLRTGRDFSKLLNSEVKVSYQGTLEQFVLKDIVSAK